MLLGSKLIGTTQKKSLGFTVGSLVETAVLGTVNKMLGNLNSGIENDIENTQMPLYKSMDHAPLNLVKESWQ